MKRLLVVIGDRLLPERFIEMLLEAAAQPGAGQRGGRPGERGGTQQGGNGIGERPQPLPPLRLLA